MAGPCFESSWEVCARHSTDAGNGLTGALDHVVPLAHWPSSSETPKCALPNRRGGSFARISAARYLTNLLFRQKRHGIHGIESTAELRQMLGVFMRNAEFVF